MGRWLWRLAATATALHSKKCFVLALGNMAVAKSMGGHFESQGNTRGIGWAAALGIKHKQQTQTQNMAPIPDARCPIALQLQLHRLLWAAPRPTTKD